MSDNSGAGWVDPTATAAFAAIGDGQVPLDALAAPVQVGLSAEELAAVQALPANCALLIVKRGPNAGSRFLLDREVVTVGRSPSSDIFFDDVTVSRKHAMFYLHEGGYAVRDVGSLNGTYVNRERTDQAVLAAGDEVQIGKYRLTYHPSLLSGASQ